MIILNAILAVVVIGISVVTWKSRREVREEAFRVSVSPDEASSSSSAEEPVRESTLMPSTPSAADLAPPVEEIARGWEKVIGAYLNQVDSSGEILKAYLQERNRYSDRISYEKLDSYWNEIHETDRGGFAPDYDPTNPLEKQKKVLHMLFDGHWKEIERLHREYVKSVQHLEPEKLEFIVPLL